MGTIPQTNIEKNIFITGASGFIGLSLLQLLKEQQCYNVKALVRKSSNIKLLHNNIEYTYGDIRNFDELQNSLNGVDIVIHLAACKADEKESYNVNVEGAKNLIKACKINGVQKIINVSTQSALFKKRGIYGETKLQADKLFEASGLNVVTLYPSLVYGSDKTGVFLKLIKQISSLPFIPILGNGKTIFQPIYVEDISKVILSCMIHGPLKNYYEVGSATPFTYDEIIDKLQAHLCLSKIKVHIPWFLGYYAARLMNIFSPSPAVTVSNTLGLCSKNIRSFDIQPILTDLNVKPLSFEKGLKIIFKN
ncbi:MAG: NAD-dependent epimerase/dehydratase family protein [Deltaproteobacteria bacterium]|nr:NAD-dependent epimerase/dehydratase family protein [Deltaproteobacteria bacterium]